MLTMLQMHLLRRGQWRPELTAGAVLALHLAAIGACIVRGLDYLRRDDDPSTVLSRVQDSAPLSIWGAAFVAAAIVAAVGIASGRNTLVGIGHVMAMTLYAGIAYGLFQETGIGTGVRTPTGLAAAAVLQGALGIGTFAVQRRAEELEHPSDLT